MKVVNILPGWVSQNLLSLLTSLPVVNPGLMTVHLLLWNLRRIRLRSAYFMTIVILFFFF